MIYSISGAISVLRIFVSNHCSVNLSSYESRKVAIKNRNQNFAENSVCMRSVRDLFKLSHNMRGLTGLFCPSFSFTFNLICIEQDVHILKLCVLNNKSDVMELRGKKTHLQKQILEEKVSRRFNNMCNTNNWSVCNKLDNAA